MTPIDRALRVDIDLLANSWPGVGSTVANHPDCNPAYPRSARPRAAALGCDAVAVAETSCPRIRRAAVAIAATQRVVMLSWPRFCDRSAVGDLGRFSRY